jgi:hypothetical protein
MTIKPPRIRRKDLVSILMSCSLDHSRGDMHVCCLSGGVQPAGRVLTLARWDTRFFPTELEFVERYLLHHDCG